MATNYTENRRRGSLEDGGHTYYRQQSLASIRKVVLGGPCTIGFGIDREIQGRYAIMCTDQLQPSHLGASQNPLHFIPEAQPRNRSTSQSGALTPERIARNMRPGEVMEGATAYTGAPVVNSRGEVIQGNGRAYMLKVYYAQFPDDPKGYKQVIDQEQTCFGFRNPIAAAEKLGIRKPVLVRLVDVPDAEAIALGQFTQADTEAIATNVTKIKAKARLLTPALQKRVIDELLRHDTNDEKTLGELIRDSKVLNVLIREEIIRPDDLENYARNGSINEAGVEFVSSLLLNASFRGSNVNTADVFALLPVQTQNAIRKSLLYLLTATGARSLNRELSNAILGYREFLSTPAPNIQAWVNQYDLRGQTAADRYAPAELAIMDLFQQSTTQKVVVEKFRQYARLVNDQPGNMFEPAKKGQTKRQALATVFKAVFVPDRRIVEKGRRASTALGKLRNRTTAARPTRGATGAAPPLPINQSDTTMTTAEKEAFKKRMAKGRALAEKKRTRKAKPAPTAPKSVKPKATKPTKTKGAGKKASSPKTADRPKMPVVKPAAKSGTSRTSVVKKRATTKSTAKINRFVSADKKAKTAKASVRVPSARQQQGANFIRQVDELAERIHQKSATGRTIAVPEYKISRSEAKTRAFKALSTARKAKNVSNIRLKI
ncbi:hypothetical protein GCM10027578_22330 [Spirosoma luteolum]